MQVTETSSAGLKREYRVVVPAIDLEAKVKERLDDLKGRVQLRGFRPGKVPVAHLKRLYGKSAMAEVIEATVREANSKIVTDHGYRLAVEPKVVLPTEEGAVEGVIEGKADLSYTVEMEIVPAITLADFKSIKLTRLTSEVGDEEIDKALRTIADQNRPFVAKTEGAANGDRVTINFEGSLEGTPFEGGTGEDVPLIMGRPVHSRLRRESRRAEGGENKTFDVKFPDDYRATHLAGKNATFAVTVKAVEAPGPVTIDDEFAKTLGVESLAKLKDAVKDRIAREHTLASRQKLKRALLDQLDERHKFEPPPSLVGAGIRQRLVAGRERPQAAEPHFRGRGNDRRKGAGGIPRYCRAPRSAWPCDCRNRREEQYQGQRRQLRAAVMEQVRQFPGQERQIWEYYQKNPNALAALRAPLFEDKVVDFLVELAEVTDKPVSRDELFKDDEE